MLAVLRPFAAADASVTARCIWRKKGIARGQIFLRRVKKSLSLLLALRLEDSLWRSRYGVGAFFLLALPKVSVRSNAIPERASESTE